MVSLRLLLLTVFVSGRPQDSPAGNVGKPDEERKADPSLITNCIAENSQDGLQRVRECLKCFEESGDPLSEEGLPKAKKCTETYLPRANKECAGPLAALEPENEVLAENSVQCFVGVAQLIAAEECLAKKASENLVETFTDGVFCLKEMHQNMTHDIYKLFENQIKRDFEKFKKSIEKTKKPKIPEEDPMRKQMMSLTSKRHCEIASNTLEEEESCMECFESTLSSSSGALKSLAACSAEHLSPHYDTCTAIMEEMTEDPENSREMGKEIYLCYMRVVTRTLVQQCSSSMEDTTPGNLLTVMQCGDYKVFEWFKNNVEIPEFSSEDYSIEEEAESEEKEDDLDNKI